MKRWGAAMAAMALVAGLDGRDAALARVAPAALAEAEARLAARFAAREVAYPPHAVTLIALKSEARLELWADAGNGWRFVRSYLVRAASGRLGPKLRQGDHQVPEGLYRIAALNPDSRYHLSLRLDYPSAFDLARAGEDGRTRLGGDIMIHGGKVSDGCLPVGDREVEELFALASRIGTEQVEVVISPADLRRVDTGVAYTRATARPRWLRELYAAIARALAPFATPAEERPAVSPRRLVAGRPRCRASDVADCTRRCAAGDMASCTRAGQLHAKRRPGASDDAGPAWTLLRQACAGGDAGGCAALAQLHVSDDGLRRDVARAADLAEAACNAGDGHGCAQLAALCVDRLVYPRAQARCGADEADRLSARATALLYRGCADRDANDCSRLADLYLPLDPLTSHRFAAAACRAGGGTCDRLGNAPGTDGAR
jgi:hypothetical protein